MNSSVVFVMDKCPYAARDSLKRKNIDEKRQLVHELAKDSDSAFDVMMKWGREVLLQVLSAELGKKGNNRKLKKVQIINRLLQVASEKKDPTTTTTERTAKRQRKNVKTKGRCTSYCKNLACQGVVRREERFCKRCSCCLCSHYDLNKDTSLWLHCETCGFSCHLECALKSEKSGIKEGERSHDADGCFYCVYCGKANSLLECWKKQLLIATETTSVEVLCSRLVLAQKLLKGTEEKHKKLSEKVEEAVKCLETELSGPLNDLSSTMCRGNINRLASAPKVKDLCSFALKSLKETQLDNALPVEMQGTAKRIRFEDVDATSLTLILGSGSSEGRNINHYRVWHRKGSEKDYTEAMTCALVSPNTRFVLSGLTPDTEYCFKVVSFSGLIETSVEETKVSTKPSQEEETSSRKNGGFELEDCVRALRQLEFAGYVDMSFRLRFLTWYGLHANADQKDFVKAVVNELMIKVPQALAQQLIFTFSDLI